MSFLTRLFMPEAPTPPPLPAAPPPPTPPKDADLRAQEGGQAALAAQVTDTENEIDSLGAPSEATAKRRSASSALLG